MEQLLEMYSYAISSKSVTKFIIQISQPSARFYTDVNDFKHSCDRMERFDEKGI